MKTIEVTIQGISPVLIHKFTEEAELPKAVKKNNKKDYGTPRDQAEKAVYADDDGTLWIPGTWIKGAFSTVSSDYKLPGSRKSVKSVIGGAILLTEEKIYPLGRPKKKDMEIDSRPVVIQRSRIMRHRGRLEKWALSFSIEIDPSIIPVEHAHEMLSDAGKRSGIGDFRASKGGPFGRFQITSWKVL